MSIECRVVRLDKISGSNGPALRVSLALSNYRPLRSQTGEMITKTQLAVLDGNGGADKLPCQENDGKRPVFEQVSSMFSTIQPMEARSLLEVNDVIEFEPTSITGTHVDSKGVYVNMRGFFTPNSYQIARALGGRANPPTREPASPSTNKVSVNMTETKSSTSEDDEGLDF